MYICIHNSVTIPHQNMDTLDMDSDVLQTHQAFHGRRQEESVILESAHGQLYMKVHLLFKVYILETTYDIAFIQEYSAVPHSMFSEDNHATGFQSLILEDLPSSMKFISPDKFVCAA